MNGGFTTLNQADASLVMVDMAGCGQAPALNAPAQIALVERFLAGA